MPPSAAETSRDGGSTLIEFTGAGSVVIRSAEQALVDLFCRRSVVGSHKSFAIAGRQPGRIQLDHPSGTTSVYHGWTVVCRLPAEARVVVRGSPSMWRQRAARRPALAIGAGHRRQGVLDCLM